MTEERNGHPLPAERRDATPAEVAALLSAPGGRFMVAAHRNADGDAVGSMLGLGRALAAAGRDVVLVHPDPDPVPPELAFLLAPGECIAHALPEDAAERTLVAVDCASAMRLWTDRAPHEGVRAVVNMDHHEVAFRDHALDLHAGLGNALEPFLEERDESFLAVRRKRIVLAVFRSDILPHGAFRVMVVHGRGIERRHRLLVALQPRLLRVQPVSGRHGAKGKHGQGHRDTNAFHIHLLPKGVSMQRDIYFQSI